MNDSPAANDAAANDAAANDAAAADESATDVETVGIDLGTTFCSVARLLEGGAVECCSLEGGSDAAGQPLLASAIHFSDRIAFGRQALTLGADDPDAVIEAFKRDMGQAHFHRKVQGNWVPPEVLSALLLDEIRRRIDEPTDSAGRAVITVPAYFDERRRKATFEAGRLAGFEVVDIINEPVAAALAELHQADRLSGNRGTPTRVMVYDLGGGTFDVSVLEINGPEVTTLASDGDVRLGGRDFDEKIVDHLAERFIERHGVDPRTDFGYAQRLWRLAEQAKRDLSTAEQAAVVCEFAGMRLAVDLSRERFERLVEPFVERTAVTMMDALEQAGLTWAQLDKVLLVGGSSRVPLVARRVGEVSGREPTLARQPDLAVAMGAALFAGMRASRPAAPLKVINVNAHSLGIAGVDVKTGKPLNRIIIPRNSRLPASKRQKFVTKAKNQRTVEIKIVEGENEDPKYCVPVGKCIATLSPDLPPRTEVRVTVRVGSNGTLGVSCHVPATDEGSHVEIRRDGLLELEPLPVWRDRLLRGVPKTQVETPDLPMAPRVESPDALDLPQVVKRIDFLCQAVGRACEESEPPPGPAAAQPSVVTPGQSFAAAQQSFVSARREHAAIRHLQAEVRNRLATATAAPARAELQSQAASLRTYLHESEQLVVYARIALGSAAIAAY
ncbi:MAG: Hsp70 family protein, partial [Planctomycetota bacterium]